MRVVYFDTRTTIGDIAVYTIYECCGEWKKKTRELKLKQTDISDNNLMRFDLRPPRQRLCSYNRIISPEVLRAREKKAPQSSVERTTTGEEVVVAFYVWGGDVKGTGRMERACVSRIYVCYDEKKNISNRYVCAIIEILRQNIHVKYNMCNICTRCVQGIIFLNLINFFYILSQ